MLELYVSCLSDISAEGIFCHAYLDRMKGALQPERETVFEPFIFASVPRGLAICEFRVPLGAIWKAALKEADAPKYPHLKDHTTIKTCQPRPWHAWTCRSRAMVRSVPSSWRRQGEGDALCYRVWMEFKNRLIIVVDYSSSTWASRRRKFQGGKYL